MTSREERMARNEVASRELNEEIEEAYQGEPPANRLDIVCECALKMCDRSIDITMAEYRMVRSVFDSSPSYRSISPPISSGPSTRTTVLPW